MFTLHFSEGKELQLGYHLLKAIAENLPNDARYTELAEALLALGIPSITTTLIGNSLLTEAQHDALWDTGNLVIRRRLVDKKKFRANLSDTQAQDIITCNDPEMLQTVATWAEMLYPDEENAEQAVRLSGGMADAVLEHIKNHPDSSVRNALIDNPEAPAKFLPSLMVCIEQGTSRFSLAGMTKDDIEAFSKLSLDTLEYVAGNVEEIHDKTVRREAAKVLIAHPDPSVRLALAENSKAPEFVLKALLNDPDLDVVATAREALEDRDLAED